MGADHAASSSLGDPEPLPQMLSGPAALIRGQTFPSASSLSISFLGTVVCRLQTGEESLEGNHL